MNFNLKGYFILVRPVNIFIGALTVFVGAVITGTIHPLEKVVLACISGSLIMAGGNVINDYFDLEIDRVNKPFRPLPSNIVTAKGVLSFAIILFALGVFLSIFIFPVAVFVAVITSIGLFFYSAKLKQTVFFGNIAVSLFSALAFIYGGIAVGRWQEALVPAGFAFLFHLGREIIKDIEDQSADKTVSAETLPLRFGTKTALKVTTVVFSSLILFTFIPYIFGIYGELYFWVVLVGVDLVIVSSLGFMWKHPSTQNLRRISAVLKADMPVGLLAIYLGLPN